MKKNLLIISIITLLIFPLSVNAQSLKLETNKKTIKPNESFTVTVYSPSSFAAMTLNVKYDDDKLDLLNAKALYGEETKAETLGNLNSVIISANKEIQRGNFYRLKFRAKNNISYDETKIKVKIYDCYKMDATTKVKLSPTNSIVIISSENSFSSLIGKIKYSLKTSLTSQIILYTLILLIIFVILLFYKKKSK